MNPAEQYTRAQMFDTYMYDDKKLSKAVSDFLIICPNSGVEALRTVLRQFIEQKAQTVPEKMLGEWLNQAMTTLVDEEIYDEG